MHYEEPVAQFLVFTMTALRTHHEDKIQCNDILTISEIMRYH